MNERLFVDKRRAEWDELKRIVDRASGAQGVRALTRDELLALGHLYRGVSADLAHARAFASNSDLVASLNGLVGAAHALLYRANASGNAARSLVNFYLYEFPALLQRHWRLYFLTVCLCLSGVGYAYWLVTTHPSAINAFIPAELRSSAEAWKSGKVSAGPQAEMSSYLMTHNFQVGMVSFAAGVAVGLPTAYMTFENGAMMGAMAALMTQYHRHASFWPGIVPHGVAELTALFICSTAGFLLALAVLAPGRLTRREALRRAGLEAVRLVLGTIPLFVFAGIIEGMFSHLPLAPRLRYAFAITNGIIWYFYLFFPRKQPGEQLELNGTRPMLSA